MEKRPAPPSGNTGSAGERVAELEARANERAYSDSGSLS